MDVIISVVIPAYNAEQFIGDCLESFLSQTGLSKSKLLEVIVVDDCSIDQTAKIVKQFCQHKNTEQVQFKLLQQDCNQGPAAARNLGAKHASGEFLLFTDSDCVAKHDWVVQMIAPFSDPSVAAVKGAYKTKQTKLVARFAQAEFESRYNKMESMPFIDVVFSYSAGFRKKVFVELGGFDTGFPTADNEDTDLSYRVATKGYKILFNRNAIIYHRHPDSLKKYLSKKYSRAYWRAVVYQRYPTKALRDSYTPQTLKLQILLIYFLALFSAISLFEINTVYVVVGLSFIFVVTILPFLMQLSYKDPVLILASPFILFCRASVMAAGLLNVVPRLLAGRVLKSSGRSK